MVRSFAPLELLHTLQQGALQLVYPRICFVCGALLPQESESICDSCLAPIVTDPHESCPRCAATIGPFTDVSQGCPTCRQMGYAFSSAIRLGEYAGKLREVILRMKSSAGESLAEVMGQIWALRCAEKLRACQADIIIPVPLHWWRRWQRGYNQAETLACALSKQLPLPYRPRWLQRVRNTPKQTAQQSRTARAENVRSAFRARLGADLKGKKIILVDDVMTTGSTINEAAKALRRAGAKEIHVAVLAHGHGR